MELIDSVGGGPLGDQFPQGMLVVQDGDNRLPPDNQNFKLIDWREVTAALSLR